MPCRVAVDTNIWVASLISRYFVDLLDKLSHLEVRLLFSEKLFDEIDNAVHEKDVWKRIFPSDYEKLTFALRNFTETVNVKSEVLLCRDPNDNFLLELAKDGNADYILTRDNDLLLLNPFGKTRIMLLSDFIKENEIKENEK